MNIGLDIRTVSGTLTIPPSKSMMQRVCAAAYLHRGRTTIFNPGVSEDDKAAINIIRQMGAELREEADRIVVTSGHHPQAGTTINCGESGLSARLFTPIAALGQHPVLITGGGSLPQRPMHFFADVLPRLGVRMPGFSGHIPFTVQGPLFPQDITVPGSLSSQFISGLLFAFAAAARQKVTLRVDKPVSTPYIDLSLQVLELFGKPVQQEGHRLFTIDPTHFTPAGELAVSVEGDWSSAAFWIAAASLSGSVTLTGLNEHSRQADRAILAVLQAAAGKLQWQGQDLQVQAADLCGFEADLTDAPDLFPVLSVLAAAAKGRSILKGVHRLAHKESDRARSISELLSLLQVSHAIEGDRLLIEGKEHFPAFTYVVPHDHRMAMAAALAALRADGPVSLGNAEAVDKSYPSFWAHVQQYCKPA
ncbi:MAG: 3-phosphoshikimate 1-carboxyvinyltransferase [Chitinophagaceae bacterium]|nr:3-phosphoshikimate 1-carboxyvinyltransferase [Chitinophagaceae bacterium]